MKHAGGCSHTRMVPVRLKLQPSGCELSCLSLSTGDAGKKRGGSAILRFTTHLDLFPFMLIAIVEVSNHNDHCIEKTLLKSGYQCTAFQTPDAFLAAADNVIFDLILVECDAVCSNVVAFVHLLRGRFGTFMPILLLSRSESEADAERSVLAGANECVPRATSEDRFLSYLAAWLRWAHYSTVKDKHFGVGRYRVMVPQRRVHVGDQTIRLTEKQFDIATAFLMNIGRVLTRDHLCNLVWGFQLGTVSRRVDTHVSQLRDKLLLDGRYGLQLLTIYGVGYRLVMVDDDLEAIA